MKNLKILKRFGIFNYPKDYKVIDLGSGLGHTIKHLSSHFTHCRGVELSLDLIPKCQEQNSIVCGDMTYTPFPNDTFDMAFCIAVIHHLPDFKHYLLLIEELKNTVDTFCKPLINNGLGK